MPAFAGMTFYWCSDLRNRSSRDYEPRMEYSHSQVRFMMDGQAHAARRSIQALPSRRFASSSTLAQVNGSIEEPCVLYGDGLAESDW